MKIDFNAMEESHLANFKGGEKELVAKMFFDGANRIMKAKLAPGASIGTHTHDTSLEVILVLKGHGHAIYDGESIELSQGDVHFCPKGHTHQLINDSGEEMEFFCVVPQL